MLPLTELVERARTVFERHPEIISAYLFGSQAQHRAGPLSDVDFAIHRDPAYRSVEEGWRTYWGDLHGELVHALGLKDDDVDLVILNDVKSSLLAHRATWCGRLISCRNHRARVAAETAILQRYLDAAPLRRILAASLRRPVEA